MEEEIEDIIGDVKYTDSQKSVATSNVYSLDFTDCSSDKNNSSGKDTYVIELCDSEDSDTFLLHEDKSVIFNYAPIQTKHVDTQYVKAKKESKAVSTSELNCSIVAQKIATKQKTDVDTQCINNGKENRAASTSLHNCSIVARETFTQTSKTIFELAQTEGTLKENLETQTSFISITENKTVEYRIEIKNSDKNIETDHVTDVKSNRNLIPSNTLGDDSSQFLISDCETIKSDDISEVSDDRIFFLIDDESKENMQSEENHETRYNDTSFEISNDSDIEEDSLMETKPRKIEDCNSVISEVPQSADEDVEELYSKLSESIDLQIDRPYEQDRILSTLTPLTEESTIKRDSMLDLTPDVTNMTKSNDSDSDILFTNAGIKVKMLPPETENFKLPPIQNRSCPNSPHLNFLFSLKTPNGLSKSALPCLYEDITGRVPDRWEIKTKNLASGESPLISGRSDPSQSKDSIHLPPIHIEGYIVNSKICKTDSQYSNVVKIAPNARQQDAISINEKIKELKQNNKGGKRTRSKYNLSSLQSRCGSPSSESPDDSRLCEAAEKGCEALCVELLKRLRSSSWYEVSDTLEEIPTVLERFWGVITEQRIADLVRVISSHVESPRTQVARCACNTVASVLKNTNYTKKPDFYEAVTLLLTKTGSFSRPVRRAANVALDDIVCGVELSHAITALCIHGIGHKNPLVRCASGRLLVVCSALAGGGRGVLRARPPSAAAARCHALRALSALLDDKNTDTRKYAERLYAMLRPLPNFEAYFLTDVDVETATKQMKKHDRQLSGAPQAK